jgi:peptidoglycan/xylan/chitin deacetylase (PgdA/CDA1 family)
MGQDELRIKLHPRARAVRWVAAFLACMACAAQPRTVALTFDDLPGTEARNRAVLNALAKHHAPAIGFVIESKVKEIELLRQWLKHGQELGNHTFSHRDMNDLAVADFESELVRGEASIKKVLAEHGRTPRYFRFPFNHSGDTQEKHDAVAAVLAHHGYRLATCTIDNEDYEFSRAYDIALVRKDQDSARKIRTEYLRYTSVEIDYYAGLHKQVFGREIPQVMLLHANQLNADLIDRLLAMFEEKHYRFVTLDEAQSDAAYATPDPASKFGEMWGYRWAKQLGIKVNGRLETEPPDWVLQYGKVNSEAEKRPPTR